MLTLTLKHSLLNDPNFFQGLDYSSLRTNLIILNLLVSFRKLPCLVDIGNPNYDKHISKGSI